MFYRRDPSAEFLPGITSRNEQNLIQLGLMKRGFSRVKMSDMNGIEGPAQNSDSHETEDRAVEESPDGALVSRRSSDTPSGETDRCTDR